MVTIKSLFKLFLILMLTVGFTGVNTEYAQAQKLKDLLKKKKKKKKGKSTATTKKVEEVKKPYAQDFEDETGISGTYYASKPIDGQDVMKFHFQKKRNGEFLNRLYIYYNEKGESFYGTINERLKEKLDITRFHFSRGGHDAWELGLFTSQDQGDVLELEKDVFAMYDKESQQVTVVFAKDKAKLEVYDTETALVKYQQVVKSIKKADMDKRKQKLLKYDVYKNNVGKIIFVEHYRFFGDAYNDDVSKAKPEQFKTSASMGRDLYWGAYLNEPANYLCAGECELNIVYEMNGVKTSRVALRNKNSRWNREIKRESVRKQFCLTNGRAVMKHSRWGFDYAFMYCAYQQKDKLQLGQKYKLKATLYTNKDGNDIDKLAEGTIMLTYDANAKSKLSEYFEYLEQNVLD